MEIVADPLRMPVRDLPLDFPNIENRIVWDFISKTYYDWFEHGTEEYPEAEMEAEEVYGERVYEMGLTRRRSSDSGRYRRV